MNDQSVFQRTPYINSEQPKTILVTGGLGFLGIHLIDALLARYPNYHIVSIDSKAEPFPEPVRPAVKSDRYCFQQVDIRNSEALDRLFSDYDITDVIHMAAETHVGKSLRNPGLFAETNALGTFYVLDAARKHWMSGPFESKARYADSRFLHISTDQVYGPRAAGYAQEVDVFHPISPYAASKASADLMVTGFHRSYGMNTGMLQAANVFGPGQQKDKLVPIILQKALAGSPVPVYGGGKDVHDWLFVDDFCAATDLAFHKGRAGESYLTGGQSLKTIDIVKSICSELDRHFPGNRSFLEQIVFVEPETGGKPPHRFASSDAKIEYRLNFTRQTGASAGFEKTIKWALNNRRLWEVI